MTDKEYELRRNALIPTAVEFANIEEGRAHAWREQHNSLDGYYDAWNRAYLGEMDRLAREAGLIN